MGAIIPLDYNLVVIWLPQKSAKITTVSDSPMNTSHRRQPNQTTKSCGMLDEGQLIPGKAGDVPHFQPDKQTRIRFKNRRNHFIGSNGKIKQRASLQG